jgi:hypothetical protein
MEKYHREAFDLQLKIHGQFATIDHNEINEKFYAELDKEGIDIDKYNETYQKLAEYYSQGYLENKDEADDMFINEVIRDMKRLIEIANMIE